MTSFDDSTCDPSLKSWVTSANQPGTDFPVQNLPLGVFRHSGSGLRSIGVAIGDAVVNLRGIAEDDLLAGIDQKTIDGCQQETLNALMALGRAHATELRLRLSELLRDYPPESSWNSFNRDLVEKHLLAQKDVRMMLPAAIGDYTDFYASIEHATRVGMMFRPERPLLPNYKYVPIGYHGRASSLVPSGTAVRRPSGQLPTGDAPVFAPTGRMDFEAELGFFIGKGNALGTSIVMDEAEQQIFGCCLVNDWSARDIQAWEYQPLGPFLGKSFATSVSPWVVTMDALAPFRVAARPRDASDPGLLNYLKDVKDQRAGAFAIQLEVRILTGAMRDAKLPPALLSQSDVRALYWTPAQMVAHHTSNGCNLRPGDLLATGTVSGADERARACLLELTNNGAQPVQLPHGEQRMFLEDGDEVMLRGWCVRKGFRRIGFGECRGIVLAAA